MGKTIIPKYRIELVQDDAKRTFHSMAYQGEPSDIMNFVLHLEASFKPGGANEHLAHRAETYINATVINQRTGELVSFWARNKRRQNV